MNPINWLKIANPSQKVKHLSNHFILKYENKFMVFTTKPVKGAESYYINTPNIQGDNSKKQYLIANVHKMDKNYIATEYDKGAVFFLKNKKELEPLLNKLKEIE